MFPSPRNLNEVIAEKAVEQSRALVCPLLQTLAYPVHLSFIHVEYRFELGPRFMMAAQGKDPSDDPLEELLVWNVRLREKECLRPGHVDDTNLGAPLQLPFASFTDEGTGAVI